MIKQSMNSSFVAIVIIVLAILGYGIFTTNGTKSEVVTTVEELTPVAERTEIDVDILSKKIFHDIDTLKVFGERPVNPKPEVLERSNPFEGI